MKRLPSGADVMKSAFSLAGKVLAVIALSGDIGAASVAFGGTRVIPPGDVQTIRADADTVLADACYLWGTLQKLGSGKLTIPAERLYGSGRILVAEGELAITANGTDTEPIAACAVLQGAALWFDAAQHVQSDDEGVKRWFDVRETNWQAVSFATNHIYGLSYTNLAKNALYPTLVPNDGAPYLHFGGASSGRWMRWNTPAGEAAWIPVVHSFVVLNPLGAHAHYLGSSSNAAGHDCYFSVSGSGSSTTYFETSNTGSKCVYVRAGRVWCDGLPVDPSASIDRNVAQLLETAAYSRGAYGLPVKADCFFNFRNYQKSAGSFTNGDRVGGTGIHEAIVFTNALTETERVSVEQYLLRKWLRKGGYAACTPRLVVSAGASCALPPAIASQFTVESEGVRRIAAGEDVKAADPVCGPSGVLAVGPGAFTNRAGFAVQAVPGRAYDVDAAQTVTVAAGSDGAVAKTGAGTLTVDGLAHATAVTLAGETRLNAFRREDLTPAALTNNCVRDGGFEGIYTGKDNAAYAKGVSFGAWVSESHYSSSKTRIHYKTSWQYLCNTNCVPEGDYYLLLKQGGAARQTVSLPADGRYAITVRCTPRVSQCAYARVLVDDFAVGTVQSRSGEPEWDKVRLVTPVLEKGEHVLRLSYDSSTDRSIGIDDVRMTWLETGAEQAVPNGNFEDICWRASATDDPLAYDPHSVVQNVYFATNAPLAAVSSALPFDALVTNWTASGRVCLMRRAPYFRCVDGKTTEWLGPVNDNGSVSLVLQACRNGDTGVGGQVAQTVKIAREGWYRLSAKACRQDLVYSGALANTVSAGTLVLGLNGTTESFAVPGHALLARQVMSAPMHFAAGATASIVVKVGDQTNDKAVDTIAVDDIRLEREPTYGNLVSNPSFEDGETGWTVVNPAAKSTVYYLGVGTFFNFSPTELPDGVACARLYSTGGQANALSQDVTVREPGIYRLGFWSSSRVDYGVPRSSVPFVVSVLKDDAVLFERTVTPAQVGCYVRREYLMRLATAGTHTIRFAAQVVGTSDVTSMLDAVCLCRVREDGQQDLGIDPKAKIRLAPEATLALDFAGTNRVLSVRRNGRSLGAPVEAGRSVADAQSDPGVLWGVGALSRLAYGLVLCVQ